MRGGRELESRRSGHFVNRYAVEAGREMRRAGDCLFANNAIRHRWAEIRHSRVLQAPWHAR